MKSPTLSNQALRFTKLKYLFLYQLVIFSWLSAYSQNMTREEIVNESTKKLPEALVNLSSFLALPNDGNYSDQVRINLERCKEIFAKIGFEVMELATGGEPLLFAEKNFHKNAKTALFYLQIDGQPVDTSSWRQPSPYLAVIKKLNGEGLWEKVNINSENETPDLDWRIFARSASDSKGPSMAFISALEVLSQLNIKPSYNIKVIMDFQEELGSPDLSAAVAEYKDLLDADMILVMDGARHISNLPTLCYGARGIALATIKVFGPKTPLHSGQYGNFAPNPVFSAAKLIAGLKDENGHVLLPGFYDGVELTSQDKILLSQIPENPAALQQRLGIAKPDQIGDTYQESLQYPSLNVRGLKSAWVGKEVRTIIPSEVIIEIDMRLVPETNGDRLMGLLSTYIIEQGFHIVDSIPTDDERAQYARMVSFNYRLGSPPFRTDFDSDVANMLNVAMARVFGSQVVNMRTTGGSQPIGAFIDALGVPAVSIRIPNPDNNIHSPNENLRIGNYLEGIQACLSILTQNLN
jgi:acetylornithine deacetylase/succinyl-diaminopimelate desuccinylase-like protein